MLSIPKLTTKFIAGLVGAPFGLQGFVKVRPLSGETGHLLTLKTATLRQGGIERALKIEASKSQGRDVLVKFTLVDTPEQAKTLSGAELLVERAQAAPLAPGEFYVEDLRGLAVESGGGETLGRITDIIEGGGGQLAEVRLAATGELKLVPFRKEFFADINVGKGTALLLAPWILE